jgi:branched-subunit amino acid aminotransferase/4-amino-4-deoxychorismate lyase
MVERIEIDGAPADEPALRRVVQNSFGHFTAMQVRGGATRGLDLHLARLDAANRELFGAGLAGDRVRELVRHALDGEADASVRVYAYEHAVMVTVRPPGELPPTPQRLRSVAYQRTAPHVKHSTGWGQDYHRREVRRDGWDEALLTGPGGVISEGGITNVGFVAGDTVAWPDAPCLAGVAMQLVRRDPDVRQVTRPIRLADLPEFEAAFVTNSRGVAPIAAIDHVRFAVTSDVLKAVARAYGSARRDRI